MDSPTKKHAKNRKKKDNNIHGIPSGVSGWRHDSIERDNYKDRPPSLAKENGVATPLCISVVVVLSSLTKSLSIEKIPSRLFFLVIFQKKKF